MIYETTKTCLKNPLLAKSTVVQTALEWAESVTDETPLGRIDIQGDDLFALVEKRESQPRDQLKLVEAHKHYFDLQYCISGTEIIDWYPLEVLKPIGDYNAARDIQFYERPNMPPFPLLMLPGCFTLLFPGDGHVPTVANGAGTITHMIVFKIRLSALFE